MACSCQGSNFSDADTNQAVLNFLENKMNIDENDVLLIEEKNSEYFITPAVRAILAVFTLGSNESEKSCEYGCAEGVNKKTTFNVHYELEDKKCIQELKVKMISNTFNYGFKSKVKSKFKATCK
jgi:hypothetical protein